MRAALAAVDPAPPPAAAAELDRYLEMAADAMQNRPAD